jgi:AraC-like DNA-binding protein
MPWSKNLTFTDPFPCQVAIQGSDTELLPTAKGDFDAAITQVRMNRLWMQRFHINLPHVSTVKMMSGRVALGFLTDEHQPTMQHCGTEVSSNDIIVNDFDVLHQRFGADIRYGSMSLALDELHDACQTITGRQFAQLASKHYIRPGPDPMSRLLKLHGAVGLMARTNPALLEKTEVVRALEHQLIHLMVRCLTEGAASKVTYGVRQHDLIVARFEEFLEANPDQPLYLTEICAAIGVAERTLRCACEEHLGMGPIRYLTLRRMHLVRRALLRANPSIATVTQIVTDHGFWELGRFAVQYKALFGESPSVSLRRPLDEHQIFLNRPFSLADSGSFPNPPTSQKHSAHSAERAPKAVEFPMRMKKAVLR